MAPVLGDGHTAARSGRADFERPDSLPRQQLTQDCGRSAQIRKRQSRSEIKQVSNTFRVGRIVFSSMRTRLPIGSKESM